MRRIDKGKHVTIASVPVYPHFKLTTEEFPRPLATRIPKDDGDEYFGPFLNRTSVRILIDFLNRTFRLRSCTIPIDGSFPVPCTQYYAKRCVAPCVASLCDRPSYLEMVDLVRLFLRDDRDLFLASVTKKIERAAEDLDYETAGFFRDILHSVEGYWSNARYQVWLDDTVDTFEVDEGSDLLEIIVVTTRRQRHMGELVFAFDKTVDMYAGDVLADVIEQLYIRHVPREIRVPFDFERRRALAAKLRTKIVVAAPTNRRVTAERAVERTRARLELERWKNRPTANEIKKRLKTMFSLPAMPRRIEAYDAAHISATGFAAAVSVWQDGNELPDQYEHWLSDRSSELDTLRAFIADRAARSKPDLILVDGGKAQLRAALDSANVAIVAAVKPKGRHSSVSHFLTRDARRIEFDQDDHGHQLLARLRDDAHDLANAAHRVSRDMMHFYELAAMLPSLNERERQSLLREFGSLRKIASLDADQLRVKFGAARGSSAAEDIIRYRSGVVPSIRPLIVPIRFVETDGGAEDLIPIETR
ncbi:MAG TPA: hypothetical protein VNA22_07815 [Pyrinomonadaceae bacterium]|nr:hypothetical protein [Pyrinomonadaceae bacterium]